MPSDHNADRVADHTAAPLLGHHNAAYLAPAGETPVETSGACEPQAANSNTTASGLESPVVETAWAERPIPPNWKCPPSHDLLRFSRQDRYCEIWKACERETGRVVALKVPRREPELRGIGCRLLEAEARVTRPLSHPHIVRTEGLLPGDPPTLVQEWLDGEPVASRIARDGRLTCRDSLWIARQVVLGLQGLSRAGFAHGDIRASSVFWCDDGSVKLIHLGFARRRALYFDPAERTRLITQDDFAYQRMLEEQRDAAEKETDHDDAPGDSPRRVTERLVAVPEYDPTNKDIAGLGVLLFHCLTGRLPDAPVHEAAAAGSPRAGRTAREPHGVRRFAPDVPREVEALTQRLLARDPFRRAGGLASLLREFLALEIPALDEAVRQVA